MIPFKLKQRRDKPIMQAALPLLKLRLAICIPDMDCLLQLYIEDAIVFARKETGRSVIPPIMLDAIVEIAANQFTRNYSKNKTSAVNCQRVLSEWRRDNILQLPNAGRQ